MAQKMQISDLLLKKILVFYNFLWILVKTSYILEGFFGFLWKKVTFLHAAQKNWAAWRIPNHPQFMCSVFWTRCENVFFVIEFLKLFCINLDTFFHIFPWIGGINRNMPWRFLSLFFFYFIASYFEELHSDTT